MYIISFHMPDNGKTQYLGPFPSEARAEEYCKVMREAGFSSIAILSLVVQRSAQIKFRY